MRVPSTVRAEIVPVAVVKILASFTIAVYGVTRLGLGAVVGDDIPWTEVAAGGGAIAWTVILFRLAISGINGVKYSDDEKKNHLDRIDHLEKQAERLQSENARLIVNVARIEAQLAVRDVMAQHPDIPEYPSPEDDPETDQTVTPD